MKARLKTDIKKENRDASDELDEPVDSDKSHDQPVDSNEQVDNQTIEQVEQALDQVQATLSPETL